MRIIVADTGPLLHLDEAGAMDLLARLGEVHVTPVVLAELRQRNGWTLPAWLKLDAPSAAALTEARSWTRSGLLHAGEAEALAHAKELKPDLFLTDDAAARVAAESAGLHVRGSLGVVLANAVFRLATREEADRILDALENRSTLWLSAKVRRAAREALETIFAGQ